MNQPAKPNDDAGSGPLWRDFPVRVHNEESRDSGAAPGELMLRIKPGRLEFLMPTTKRDRRFAPRLRFIPVRAFRHWNGHRLLQTCCTLCMSFNGILTPPRDFSWDESSPESPRLLIRPRGVPDEFWVEVEFQSPEDAAAVRKLIEGFGEEPAPAATRGEWWRRAALRRPEIIGAVAAVATMVVLFPILVVARQELFWAPFAGFFAFVVGGMIALYVTGLPDRKQYEFDDANPPPD